jgi:hypothetical protein
MTPGGKPHSAIHCDTFQDYQSVVMSVTDYVGFALKTMKKLASFHIPLGVLFRYSSARRYFPLQQPVRLSY